MGITILLIILAGITLYITISWFKLTPYNQKPLEIKTFDGNNSPYHPTVLYFKDGWNGYKYWMAETPFPPNSKPYRDRNECPSIHVSNDGVMWTEITQNPIDDLTEKEIKELDYFSDPHLVFVDEKIECWYRFTHRDGIDNKFNNLQLVRKTSSDGINWSKRDVLVNLATSEGDNLGNMVVSPAILYQDGKYRMWYVNSESREQRELSYSESIDGKNWAEYKRCTLQGIDNTPWHIDVNFIDGIYYLISYNFKNLTLFKSVDGITFNYVNIILEQSVDGSFYSGGLYRACIIKDNNLKIYFSANDVKRTHIGLLEGDDCTQFQLVEFGKFRTFFSFAKYFIAKKMISICFITKQLFKRF